MTLIDNRHDFINNSLRIEILNKLVCQELEKNQAPNQEHVEDLKKFLEDHLKYLEEN